MVFKKSILALLTLLTAWGWWVLNEAGEHEVEIAAYMGDLQRFSQKMGYAVASENHRLTDFYRHELDEVFLELKEVEEHDGFPIGSTVKTIVDPIMKDLTTAMTQKDWARIRKDYLTLIDGCNRCHAATEHEFIVITPANGTPPYNQKF